MKRIIHLYGNKAEIEERIRSINPDINFFTVSLCLDNSVMFEDVADDEFWDICEALGDCLYSDEDASLEQTLIKFLVSNKLKIATAESCTGGLVSASIVNVSGASKVFYEGVVTYSNEAKMRRLGVQESTLESFGAVSAQTAEEMAGGLVCRDVDVAISTTGIAGPAGGTEEKPVGLVYIGIALRDQPPISHRLVFDGNREQIRQCAKNSALFYALQYLKDNL